ncbi:MAG: hypothetical protein BWY83_02144 [bacterium ADurb.Bin478]|nr:MAG: hypothetical protein BWY83_02144 [bacterium ADurb.Bin478]
MIRVAGAGQVHRIRGRFGTVIARAWFVLTAEEGFPVGAVQPHPSLGSIEQVADSDVAFIVGVQAAHFELHDLAVIVFKSGKLLIRGLLIVIKSIMTADAFDLFRMHAFVQTPAGDIQLMRPLIAEIGAAVIPEPVPVVVKAVGVERLVGRRPQPQVVMHSRRNGRIQLFTDGVARFETQSFGHVHIAETAFV